MTFNPDWFTDRLNQLQCFEEMLARERPETLMMIVAEDNKGKTWLLRRMEQHCAEASPSVQSVYIEFADPRINAVDALGFILLLRDKLDAPEHFEQLDAVIGRHVGDPGKELIRPMQLLADEINESFLNEDELRIFARFLGANYDDLPGNIKREKAFQLVNYCREEDSLTELLENLIRERDHKSDDWKRLVNGIIQAAEGDAPGGPIAPGAKLSATGAERERILHAITKVFIACLSDYLSSVSRLVLLIDSYQDGSYDAKGWLEDSFQLYLTDEAMKAGLVLIVAGRQTMDVADPAVKELAVKEEKELLVEGEKYKEISLTHGLRPFNSKFIAEYSRKRQINAEWAAPEKLEVDVGGEPGDLAFWYDLQMRRGRR
jgi:hypothetical protein